MTIQSLQVLSSIAVRSDKLVSKELHISEKDVHIELYSNAPIWNNLPSKSLISLLSFDNICKVFATDLIITRRTLCCMFSDIRIMSSHIGKYIKNDIHLGALQKSYELGRMTNKLIAICINRFLYDNKMNYNSLINICGFLDCHNKIYNRNVIKRMLIESFDESHLLKACIHMDTILVYFIICKSENIIINGDVILPDYYNTAIHYNTFEVLHRKYNTYTIYDMFHNILYKATNYSNCLYFKFIYCCALLGINIDYTYFNALYSYGGIFSNRHSNKYKCNIL